MKVTYLLGAGASAASNAATGQGSVIPVVAEFSKQLEKYVEALSGTKPDAITKLFTANQKPDAKTEFHALSESFLIDLKLHFSVDTLARKYFVKYGSKSSKLQFLKFCVSSFLHYRQYTFGIDPRYDLFFAAIGEAIDDKGSGINLPNSVSIISWNYDNQVEMSIQGFGRDMDFKSAKILANMTPSISTAESMVRGEDETIRERFQFVKLNGSADLIVRDTVPSDTQESDKESSVEIRSEIQYTGERKIIDFGMEAVKFYETQLKAFSLLFDEKSNSRSLLSFAWENDGFLQDGRQQLASIAQNTQVLVVIGYSFPTFNRTMDAEWAEKLPTDLQKIYIQVPTEDFEAVKSRLIALFPDKRQLEIESRTKHISQLDEFYVPYELADSYAPPAKSKTRLRSFGN